MALRKRSAWRRVAMHWRCASDRLHYYYPRAENRTAPTDPRGRVPIVAVEAVFLGGKKAERASGLRHRRRPPVKRPKQSLRLDAIDSVIPTQEDFHRDFEDRCAARC